MRATTQRGKVATTTSTTSRRGAAKKATKMTAKRAVAASRPRRGSNAPRTHASTACAPPVSVSLPCNRRSVSSKNSSSSSSSSSRKGDGDDGVGVAAIDALTPCVSSIMLTWAANDALHAGGAVPYLLSNGSYGVYFVRDGSCLQLMHATDTTSRQQQQQVAQHKAEANNNSSSSSKEMLQLVLYVDATGCGFAFTLLTPDPRSGSSADDAAAADTLPSATHTHVATLLQHAAASSSSSSSSLVPPPQSSSCVVVPSALQGKFALLMWARRWRRALHRPDGRARPAALVHVTHDTARWQSPVHDGGTGATTTTATTTTTTTATIVNVGFGVRVTPRQATHIDDEDSNDDEAAAAAAQWRVPYVCHVTDDAAHMPASNVRCVVTLANVVRPYRRHVYAS